MMNNECNILQTVGVDSGQTKLQRNLSVEYELKHAINDTVGQ